MFAHSDKEGDFDAIVTIKGAARDANDAKKDILNLTSSNSNRGRDYNDNSRNYESQSNSDSKETLDIYPDKVGMVIGRGGSTIKDLQSKYFVRINVDKNMNSYGKCSVTVSGGHDNVSKAIENIRELVGEPRQDGAYQNNHASNPEPEPMDFQPIDWQAAARESVSRFYR